MFFVFYCAALKLNLEIDGEIHNEQKEKDQLRDEILSSLGYRTIRITNDDVIGRIESVIDIIKKLASDSIY